MTWGDVAALAGAMGRGLVAGIIAMAAVVAFAVGVGAIQRRFTRRARRARAGRTGRPS